MAAWAGAEVRAGEGPCGRKSGGLEDAVCLVPIPLGRGDVL